MDISKIVKILIVLILLVIGGPILIQFLPSPLTMERIADGLKKSDLGIYEIRNVEPPTCESIAQIQFTVNGAIGNVYQYDNEGTIARYAEMYKKDPGTAIVEAWGLAQSLGAAPPRNKPEKVARRRMFLLVVQGDDPNLLERIVKIFQSI
ncbi:MAG TPA: hypothetical protein PLT82_01565 [Candidatus Hydrogenedens sp.]|nr:hypothetical protein [Candidatus Hydrogenedens sp.]HOK08533.1 hypothetical protein [Candidatus Hydrogenedens sp.]HOL19021.1 hypothetical protein [Candidatus Hydrogenedens sp.]HPP57797.1 hypothetical protein [Candidatus Hydrogenedens sp.]